MRGKADIYKYITMKEQQEQCKKSLVSQNYRKFLQLFKTHSCPYQQPHAPEYCTYYHYQGASYNATMSEPATPSSIQYQFYSPDHRKNPYGKLNKIVQYAQFCPNVGTGCQNQECKYCHNVWEYNYHPLVFKTINCDHFYECSYQFCCKLHYCDFTLNSKTQVRVPKFSQFFRFDIMTFKSLPCKRQRTDIHDRNSCLGYHNQNDYRRPNFQKYDHIKCENKACQNPDCPFSHNRIEQLYHPSRYKSKFCETHFSKNPNGDSTQKSLCQYGKFCSFAHDDSEISVELIEKMQRNLEFHLYAYKTVWCPIITDHNRYVCVYAHNVQDFRRNPKQYCYEPIQCPYWKKNQNIKSIEDAGCPDGMDCKKCHGWKEKEYHPIIYCKNKGPESCLKNKSDSFTLSEGARQKSPYVHSSKRSQILLKKLGAEYPEKNARTNLESIVQTMCSSINNPQTKKYSPGAPFFTNNTTGNKKYQSQKGDAKQQTQQKTSREQQKRGSVMSTKSIAIKGSQNDDSEDIDDTQLFKLFESGNQKTCDEKRSCLNWTQKNDSQLGNKSKLIQKVSRTVSKSVGCNSRETSNHYSKDIVQLLNPQIIKVLRDKNIYQIKLINMKEQQIRSIEELTNSQKSLIIKKILKARDNARKTPTYQNYLQKTFLKHRRLEILLKMKNKKVRQSKLLLLDSEIKQFSFLSESQKSILPKIISQFKDNKDFEQLSVDIGKSLCPEDQPPQQQ